MFNIFFKLKYDLRIVCFSSLLLAGNQLRIPSGPLREKLSNLRKFEAVFINGKKAKVIGNICMDIFMIDVSDIDCKEFDEVIIFDKENPASVFAESAGTISYEILSGLSNRIKRIYFS